MVLLVVERLTMNRLIYSTLLLVTGALSVCAQEPTLGYHQQLATYQDSSGNEHPIKTIADWQIRREQILSGMQAAMGSLPDRNHLPSLDVEIVATEERRNTGA